MLQLSSDGTGLLHRRTARPSHARASTGGARVDEVRVGPNGCTLVGTSAEGRPIEVVVGVVPDRRQALRWGAAFRRLSWVELCRRDGRWQCTIHGTGHRLPTSRRAPVSVGLGLALTGTPLLLCEELG